jgi:UDP-N-acetylmuramate--alanine ligase
MTAPDLATPRRVHIIGIGGAGMGAIAEVLHAMGHDVAGSDLSDSGAFRRVREFGMRAELGHDTSNLQDPDVVVRSTAIPDHNVEVQAVEAAGGTVLRRAELLAAISDLRTTVAVAGTHGKTTTTSMLAVIALHAGLDPSFIIGGDVTELSTGAAWGIGDHFIVEADESDGTFLELGHSIGIVTNVEPDHLEHYGGEIGLRQAFVDFVAAAETAIICADDEGAARLMADGVSSYGFDAAATHRMTELERTAAGSSFRLTAPDGSSGRLFVPMPGLHNARNAAAAATAALAMGVSFDDIAAALETFRGVGRRFQPRGEANDIVLIDDYAHLPTEVDAAIDAATDLDRERIVAVFQPHRYSRMEALWQDFVGSFDRADLLVITGIYSSGERPRPGITSQLIVDAVNGGSAPPPIVHLPDRETLASEVAALLQPGDVCLTLGAGDLVNLPDEILPLLEDR